MEMNELESGGGASPAAGVPQGNDSPQAPGSIFKHFSSQHDDTNARYEKLSKADETLKSVRKIMDKLVSLGDMIQEDDVMDAASSLVAAGLTSAAVAGLLADAPANPEGLQAWVVEHDADVTKREAQLGQVLANARHEMAVKGLKALAGHAADDHFAAQDEQQAMPPQQQSELESGPPAPAGMNPLEGAPANAG